MKKISVEYLLYFLLVFLSIFNDSYFSRWFGYFGRPILSVFLPVLVIVALVLGIKFKIDKTARTLLKLLALLAAINFFSDTIYMILSDSGRIGNDYIVVKSINSLIAFLYIPVYYILLYTLMEKIPKRKICIPFIIAFFFLFFVLIVELATVPTAWPIFHYNNSGSFDTSRYYSRVRLTTTEASLTVPMIITYGVITLWHYKHENNKIMVIVSSLLLVCFAITSTARTFIVFFAIVLVFSLGKYLIKRKRTGRGYVLFGGVLLSLPVAVIVGVLYVYTEIFTKYLGSLAIRVTSLIAGIVHMLIYPFGMGNSVSVLTMQNILENVVDWFATNSFSSLWNYWDVRQVLLNPESISTYGILTYGIYWGMVGIVLLYIAFVRIYKQYKISFNYSPVVGVVFWGYVGIMTLTVPMDNCFSFWAFLVFISILSREGTERTCDTTQKHIPSRKI